MKHILKQGEFIVDKFGQETKLSYLDEAGYSVLPVNQFI